METTIQLQDPFQYSFLLLAFLSLIVFGYLIFLIVSKIVEKAKAKKPKVVAPPPVIKKPVDIGLLKSKYIAQVNNIELGLDQGAVGCRDAYQQMSMCIRSFVNEATGINVQSCTLQDIKALNMPALETLIQEYYAPEFARDSIGDAKASLEKTRRAIETWN